MKTKIAFNDIPNVLDRNEMKEVVGGFNSIIWGNTSTSNGHTCGILPIVMESGGGFQISFSFGGSQVYTFTVPKDTVWGGQLNEVVIPPRGSSAEQALGAIAFGWDVKTMLSQLAVGGDAAGDFAGYIKYLEAGGLIGLTAGAFNTLYEGLTSEWRDYHTADLGTQALIFGAATTVPVAGWALGAAYFLGNYYTEQNYGQGLYEHLNPN